jgi:membrane fusion protein, multidrug efflux system
MRTPRSLPWFYALLASLSLSSCGLHLPFMPSDESEPAKSNKGPQSIPAVRVQSGILDREDVFPAELLAYQDVAIYPKVPGFIKWIGVDRGSTVKQGQLMVRLEAPELQEQKREATAKVSAAEGELLAAQSKLKTAQDDLAMAQAKFESDDSTYQRVKTAAKIPGVIADNEVVVLAKGVESDRALVAAKESNVKSAQAQLVAMTEHKQAAEKSANSYRDIAAYLNITAPFDGYVTERNLHTGSFVGPLGKGAYPSIVRVQQLSLLRLVAPVPEVDAGGVEPGAKVDFTVSTYPGERFSGDVARIGNYLDEKTRTMPVELNVWNPGWRLKPGMFAEVHWPTRRKHPTLFVPSTAVAITTYQPFLCVLDGGVVKWVSIKRGLPMKDMVEVFGDLKEGQIVAVHGTDELREGTAVEPKMETKPAAIN